MSIFNSQPAGFSDTAEYLIIINVSISNSKSANYSDLAEYSTIIIPVSIHNSHPAGYYAGTGITRLGKISIIVYVSITNSQQAGYSDTEGYPIIIYMPILF